VVIVVYFFFLVVFLVVHVAGDCVLDALGQTVAVQCLGDVFVLGNRRQKTLVDSLAGVGLLHYAEYAVVQVLVELLRVGKSDGAGRASTGDISLACKGFAAANRLLAAVGGVLFDTMDRREMSFENVGAVEALLSRRPAPRAEAADHRPFVVCECMPVLVVLPCEAFNIVLARGDGALFRPLIQVGEHVCFQVLEDSAAFRKKAKSLFARLVVQIIAAAALTTSTRMLRVERCDGAAPSPVVLLVGVMLLRAKVGAYTALLHSGRTRPLALRGDVGQSGRRWLFDDWEVRRRHRSDLRKGAVRSKCEWLYQVRV
jgi:hypothetical protein